VKIFIENREFFINIKGYLLIFGLILIGMVVIFSFSMGNVSAAGNTVYVNASGGHDASDGSSWLLAKKTIKNATGNVKENGIVKIANGKYTGVNNTNITIDKSMNIAGQSQKYTIINGTGTNWIFNIADGIHITITNLTMTNATWGNVGAIWNRGNLTIIGCTCTNNTSTNVGAIYNDHGTLNVKDSTFNGNNAAFGSALYNNGGNLNVTSSTFTSNSATGHGGAIAGNGGSLTNVTGCIFKGNTAVINGGAIEASGDISLNVTGSIFNGNTATNGGAIYNYGDFKLNGSNFTNNTANDGGAVYNEYSTSTLKSSTFTSNKANNGGAVYNDQGNLTIIGCNLKGNTGNSYGGAVYTNNILNVTSNTFDRNTAGAGGAIFNSGFAPINVHFNRIIGNTASIGKDIDSLSGTLNADLNWWGGNNGPVGRISGLTVNNWLVLRLIAVPSSVQLNSYSHIIADLRYDNLGNVHTEGYLPNGTYSKFTTTFGTLTNTSTTINGVTRSYFKSSSTGTANVSIKLDNQTLTKKVKIVDTIPPKVTSTTPKNNSKNVPKTIIIIIKFSENIKTSTYFNNMTIKNLSTNKNLALSRSISGNTLTIKTSTKNANTTYQVTIPKSAIKDMAGNNLAAAYTIKFKTGA